MGSRDFSEAGCRTCHLESALNPDKIMRIGHSAESSTCDWKNLLITLTEFLTFKLLRSVDLQDFLAKNWHTVLLLLVRPENILTYVKLGSRK